MWLFRKPAPMDTHNIINIHEHCNPVLLEVRSLLQTLIAKVESMHAETKALVVELNDATNAVAAKLDKLIADAAGGLTKDEATEHINELTVIRDHLRAMGADPTNPLP